MIISTGGSLPLSPEPVVPLIAIPPVVVVIVTTIRRILLERTFSSIVTWPMTSVTLALISLGPYSSFVLWTTKVLLSRMRSIGSISFILILLNSYLLLNAS